MTSEYTELSCSFSYPGDDGTMDHISFKSDIKAKRKIGIKRRFLKFINVPAWNSTTPTEAIEMIFKDLGDEDPAEFNDVMKVLMSY